MGMIHFVSSVYYQGGGLMSVYSVGKSISQRSLLHNHHCGPPTRSGFPRASPAGSYSFAQHLLRRSVACGLLSPVRPALVSTLTRPPTTLNSEGVVSTPFQFTQRHLLRRPVSPSPVDCSQATAQTFPSLWFTLFHGPAKPSHQCRIQLGLGDLDQDSPARPWIFQTRPCRQAVLSGPVSLDQSPS